MLQQYVNQELPDVQAGFRKSGIIRYNIANIQDQTASQANSIKYLEKS